MKIMPQEEDNRNIATTVTNPSRGKDCNLQEIHCTVCSALLTRPPSATTVASAASEEDTVPFIVLACTEKYRDVHSDLLKNQKPQSASHSNDNNNNNRCCCYRYYCVPDCWEHFLSHHWGLYSGLGQAHTGFVNGLLGNACQECRADVIVVEDYPGSLSLEASLAIVSPNLLAKAFAAFHRCKSANELEINDVINENATVVTDGSTNEAAVVRRITQDLEEQRLLKCPSCHFKIAIPEDRGCDAGWCEHCGRAFCLYCLTDCGDHPKTDPTASNSKLIGDAHDHVMNNDCGLTAGKGHLHSGKNLARYHERQFFRQVALRLKRVSESVRNQVCHNLLVNPDLLDEMLSTTLEDQTSRSITKLRREMENDKWEYYPNDRRVRFLHAAFHGDLPMIQCLSQVGIPHNIPDAVSGETALHFASVRGHVNVVQYLLTQGANPWQLSPPGRTPLDDLCNIQSECCLVTARCLITHCMLSVAAIFENQDSNVYPWLRPWPNGTTALSSAKEHHPESPVSSYFLALQEKGFRLCKAAATGRTQQVKHFLSNKSSDFPRPREGMAQVQMLPPACDLVWVYNKGSGCTPLLDLCAKSLKLSPQHIHETAKMILAVASSNDLIGSSEDSTNNKIKRLLQMRDFKFNATALHWLALDPRRQLMKTAGLFLQHAGTTLVESIDRRGLTALDWARRFSVMPENPAEENDTIERQRHVGRWEVLMLAWEEEAA